MAKSQETFNKKEKKRLKKRQEKQAKKEERRANSDGGGLDNMMAYVDENGMLTDTPPDPNAKRKVIKASSIEIGVPKRLDDDEPSALQGRVTFFNDSKGYGFIKDLNSQENFFVHVNGLLEEIRENDIVTFELERGQKGMNAVRVKIVRDEPKPKKTEEAKPTEEASDDKVEGKAEDKVEDKVEDKTEEASENKTEEKPEGE